MKTLISLVSAIAISSSSLAALTVEDCTDISELAGAIMQARQSGVPASDLVTLSKNHFEGVSTEYYEASILMITHAFSEPKYSTPAYQQNSINEFKNDYFIACINR